MLVQRKLFFCSVLFKLGVTDHFVGILTREAVKVMVTWFDGVSISCVAIAYVLAALLVFVQNKQTNKLNWSNICNHHLQLL